VSSQQLTVLKILLPIFKARKYSCHYYCQTTSRLQLASIVAVTNELEALYNNKLITGNQYYILHSRQAYNKI